MAISWGPPRSTSGIPRNGVRVGIDLSYSGSGSSRTVVFELWVWTMYSTTGTASYSREWDFASGSGSFTPSHTSGVEWSTANRTRIGRWTANASLRYGETRTITASGSVWGLHGSFPSGSTSHSTSVTLPARPYLAAQTPSNVRAVRQSAGSVLVSWNRRPTTARPATHVRVERQQNTTSGAWNHVTRSTGSSVTSSTGVSAGNRYRYRLRAEGPGGNSAWVYTSWTDYWYLSPNAPTGVSVARHSDDAHTVSWSHSSSSARPVDRFRVQRRVWGTSESWGNWVTRATVGSGTRSYRDTTRDNRTYQYRVRAENSAGSATSSSSGSVWTTPWVPTNVSAQSTATGVRLRWRDATTSGNADFQIERREDDGSWGNRVTHSGGAYDTYHTWTLTDPDLAVTHQFRIRSRNTAASPTLYSDWVTSNVVQLAAPPAAPTGLGPSAVWDASEDRILTWRHVPTDGSGQERFQVRHRLQGGSWTTVSAVASESEQWTLPGGTYEPGDTIEWQVRTMGVHPDWGPWSASNFQSPTSRPTVAINDPLDGALIETNAYTVTWGYSGPDQDDDDQGEVAGQAAWRLTLLREGSPVAQESGSDDRDSYRITGLGDGRFYTIRVEVRSGEGLWSAPDEVHVEVSYLPPAPPQIGVSFDRERGAAVVDVANLPAQDSYEVRSLVTNPRGRTDDEPAVDEVAVNLAFNPEAVSTDGFYAGGSTVLEHTGEAVRWTIVNDRGINIRMGEVTREEGQEYTLLVRARASQEMSAVVRIGGTTATPTTITTEWTWHRGTAVSDGDWRTGLLLDTTSGLEPEAWVEVDRVLMAYGTYTGDWFSGDSEDYRTGGSLYSYQWDGDPNASVSRLVETVLPAAPGWSGPAWYDPDRDAVLVGTEAQATAPHDPVSGEATLVLYDVDTQETAHHQGRADGTLPTLVEDRYLRVALVQSDRDDEDDEEGEGGGSEYTGPYFDGDTPMSPGEGGLITTYEWAGAPHDSATIGTVGSIPVDHNQLWRAVDDGPWLLIADEVPIDTAISDPIPAIGDRRTTHYRVTAISAIGSAMHSDPTELVVPTHGPGGNHGWVYINGGTDFSDVVKVRANATRSGSQGLAKGVRRYAGNPRAQQRTGTALHRTWSLSINARDDLYAEGASHPEEIEAIQTAGGVVCYRDPKGARWFASMGMMDDSYRGITGEVSWPMEEVDEPEGLASESRDVPGDEDAA